LQRRALLQGFNGCARVARGRRSRNILALGARYRFCHNGMKP
jgi:hypothetical protein